MLEERVTRYFCKATASEAVLSTGNLALTHQSHGAVQEEG